MWGRLRGAGVVVCVIAIAVGLVPTAVQAEAVGFTAGPTERFARNSPSDAATVVELTDDQGQRTHLAPGSGAAEILTPEITVPEFHVAGVTWHGGVALPAGAQIHLRVLENGRWTDWLEAEIEESPAGDTGLVNGTEPFITGGATAAQLRVTGGRGPIPPGLELTLLPANASMEEPVSVTELPTPTPTTPDDGETPEQDATDGVQEPTPSAGFGGTGVSGAGTALGLSEAAPLALAYPAAVATPAGAVVPRAEWGADEAYTDANWAPKYFPLEAAIVHHTAGTNTYSAAESAGIVKAIYVYHTLTRGWGDIGYNFLVDKYGTVFEGRKYSLASQPGIPAGWMIEAGHASGYNKGSLGISAMGDFTLASAPGTSPILSAMARVIAWKFADGDIDPAAASAFVSPAVRGTTTYPTGTSLPRIFGHKDVAQTACPGGLYNELGVLRQQVAGLLSTPIDPRNIARSARPVVSASSEDTAEGSLAVRAVDGSFLGYPTDPTKEWSSDAQKAGAWIQLTWPDRVTVDRVVLVDRPNADDHVLAGTLTFSDGTSVAVGALDNAGAATPITFPARTVTWVRFTVTAVSSSTYASGLAELEVYGAVGSLPVADAGADQSVTTETKVILDGSQSSDPDAGTTLSFAWAQTGGPVVALSGASSAKSSFTPTEAGTYTFELTVSDGSWSTKDQVTVEVAPAAVACAAGEFLAEYYSNMTLSGDPVVVRCEAEIANEWGTGGPGGGVPVNGFSVRWTGTDTYTAGDWVVTTRSDDGVRVWVDGDQVINNWTNHAATTDTARVPLTAGDHTLVMEYYENTGSATATLTWEPAPTTCAAGEFLAQYYPNMTLSGDPVVVRCEAEIVNEWGTGGPGGGVPVNGFSVRWTGTDTYTAADWVVTTVSDDGVRVWVDGDQVINNWTNHAATTDTARVPLTAGDHTLVMEYYENTGSATATLTWEPAPTTCAAGEFLAEYYSNMTLSGDPVVVRCEAEIVNEWGTGGPGGGVPVNGFSVRWTGTDTYTAGDWVVTTRSDDGVRVWVDGDQVINNWTNHAATTDTARVPLTAGEHTLVMEYYENTGSATATLTWEPAPTTCAAGEFLAEYYSNMTLSGDPVVVRCEAEIVNEWGTGGPGGGVPVNGFSVRWTGTDTYTAGDWVVTTRSDDGVRVWVDGDQVINNWTNHAATTDTARVPLTAGEHTVVMEYYENTGSATATLTWEPAA